MLRLATHSAGIRDSPSMRKIYYPGASDTIKMTKARKRFEVFETYGEAGFTLKELAGAGCQLGDQRHAAIWRCAGTSHAAGSPLQN